MITGMKKLSAQAIQKFRETVWDFYCAHKRASLPWRPPQVQMRNENIDVYPILVSEIMLQQTQVSRVLPKFESWMRQLPNVKALASASRKDVLALWQGLGYTRRAKFLHEIGEYIAKHGEPKTVAGLEQLPGIGHYTARAVATFAWNESHALVETNIRTVYIHHFFKNVDIVSDKDIVRAVEQTLDTSSPREWMYALMDYGAYLKLQGKAHNARAKSFTRQSKFKGSVREVRGVIMKFFTQKSTLAPKDVKQLESVFGDERVQKALTGLLKDGLIKQGKRGYRIES